MQTTQDVRVTGVPPVQHTGCCPPFEPSVWDGRELVWNDKPFVIDHVHSLFHVPLDLSVKVSRNQRMIAAAGAWPSQAMMLTDETSLFGADIFLDVTRPVPGAKMTTLSGPFFAKVFEGPYRDAGRWAQAMKGLVAGMGRKLEKLYFWYTTCPRCAKAYGKNYVVLLAKLGT